MQFDEYTHGVVEINGTTATNKLRVENLAENPDAQTLRKIQSGQIQPSFIMTATLKPKITFDTQEIAKALDLMTATTAIKGVAITTKCTLYYPKVLEVDRSSGSDHQITDINEGIVIPRTLRWNGENEIWMLSCEILSAYDGSNKPLVYGMGALPADIDLVEAYIGGKLVINSVEQDCWQQATVDFAFEGVQRHCKGGPYPGRAHVFTQSPFLEIPTLDLPARGLYTLDGTTITQCDLYLRKANGPIRYGDATANHIKFATVAGQIRANQVSGINPTQVVVRVDLNKTAAAPAIAYTKGIAIP